MIKYNVKWKMKRKFVLGAVSMIAFATPNLVAVDESTIDALEKKDPWALTLYFENDLFADTDQQYTNETKISWYRQTFLTL